MKKIFTGKTLDDVLQNAREEFKVDKRNLYYTIIGETKKFFSKRIEVECFTTEEVIKEQEEYIRQILKAVDIDLVEVSTVQEGRDIKITIKTSDDPMVIGKHGKNLRAITDLVRAFASANYKKRFLTIVDVAGYKETKYPKLENMAKRIAKEVQLTKVDAKLDPMSNDERKVIHKVLQEFEGIKTESRGVGKRRHLMIIYIGKK